MGGLAFPWKPWRVGIPGSLCTLLGTSWSQMLAQCLEVSGLLHQASCGLVGKKRLDSNLKEKDQESRRWGEGRRAQ